MISLISRKFGNSKDVMLSVRVKTENLNTAVALGISVSPARWQVINESIKNARKAYRRGTTIFMEDSLTSNLWMIVKGLMIMDSAGIISKDKIEKTVLDCLHKEEKTAYDEEQKRKRNEVLGIRNEAKLSFHQFFDQYYNDIMTGKRLKYRSTKRISHGYAETIRGSHDKLKKFEEANHMVLDWEDLTLTTLVAFKDYLVSTGLRTNTINTHLVRLRTVLGAAKKMHYTVNTDFENAVYIPQETEVDNVYISTERIQELFLADYTDEAWLTDQINKIPGKFLGSEERESWITYYHEAKHRQKLNDARDLFVVGCLTGQRYSDFSRISKMMYVHYDGRTFIRLNQMKTGAEIYIPLNPVVNTILERHDNAVPKMYRLQLSKLMQACALILGWTEDFIVTEQQGSLEYQKPVPFYKMIRTHTCRRSFATNAYQAKVSLSSIMAVTGHSSEDMLRKYLKLTKKERALLAATELEKATGF